MATQQIAEGGAAYGQQALGVAVGSAAADLRERLLVGPGAGVGDAEPEVLDVKSTTPGPPGGRGPRTAYRLPAWNRRDVLGIAETFCCTSQRRQTCAAVLPWLRPIRASVSSFLTRPLATGL